MGCVLREYSSNDKLNLKRIFSSIKTLLKNKDVSVQDLLNKFYSGLGAENYNILGNEALVKDLKEEVDGYISRQNNDKQKNLSDQQVDMLNKFVERVKTKYTKKVKSSDSPTQPESAPEQNTNPENSEEVKNDQKIKDFLKGIYGNALSALEYRNKLFSDDVNTICIVDFYEKTLTMNNEDLNDKIREYKQKQFGYIVQYLKSIGKTVPQENMFQLSEDEYILNTDYISTLNMMYRHIKEDKNATEAKLKSGWSKQIKGESDLFYLATNAYANLFYFDRLLKQEYGKVIEISKDVYTEEIDPKYQKYKFSKKAAELAKGWETQENRDALQDTARFSKRIIESIPMQSYQKKTKYPFNLTMVSFSNAMTNLFSGLLQVNNKSKGSTSADSTTMQEKILDLLFKFHEQPRTFMSQVLSELFKIESKDTLKQYNLTKFDLDVLYSIHDYMQKVGEIEDDYIKLNFTSGMSQYPISECVLGVVDRVMQMSYMQTTIDENKTVISIKSKFPKRQREYNLRNSINFGLASRLQSKRDEIQRKYNVRKESGRWYFTIGNTGYSVEGNRNIFLSSELNAGNIENIDLDKNRELLLGDDSELSERLRNFKNILLFIEDNLAPFKILTDTGIDKIIAAQQVDEKILNKLFGAAAKNAIINKMYLDFSENKEEKNFYTFLTKTYPELLLSNLGDQANTVFTQGLGQKNLVGVRISDEWIDTIVDAEMVVNGDVSKANTKDIFGNSMGNYSTSFLGGNLLYYLFQSKYQFAGKKWQERENSPQKNLLFTRQNNLISNIVINTDAVSRSGEKKNVRNMKPGELYYQAIFHHFWKTSTNTDKKKGKIKESYVIQPTTYSDKTKFVQYVIDPNKKIESGQFSTEIQAKGRTYFDKTLSQLDYNELEQLYLDTIGEYYKQIYSNTINKYGAIFEGVTDRDSLLNKLNQINSLNRQSLEILAERNGFKLTEDGDFREDYLIKLAQSKGVQLMLDSDYRVKGGKLYFNELLEYYVNHLYNNQENLRKRLELEKQNFIKDLKDSNTIFYTKYLDGTTNTVIQDVIDEVFLSEKYSSKKDYKYKVLYEKLGLKEGDNIRAKFQDIWVKNSRLLIEVNGQLNPLFEYYFMMDSLLSNNIRFSLTGTELSHKIKSDEVIDVSDPNWYNEKILLETESLAQSAQLKRNVIIPGTLQYMQQDTLRGVTNRLRMAVIRDLKIPVFNFRGKVDWIDSSDGAAFVNPFASILENNSLQDQKVGDIKKTIMHSMDYKTGGAVLGKWATFALTNELMNQTLNSDVDLYNIFKKLTNHQWYINGQLNSEFIDVSKMKGEELDLTQVRGKIGLRGIKFQEDILKDRDLFYLEENYDGTSVVKRIRDFGKDEFGYYTEEVSYDRATGSDLTKTVQRVYHLFDDKSNHLKLTKEELELVKDRNLHTINSLYELHAAMGGLASVDIDEDGKVQQSESSNYAVVEFMNIVAIEQSGNRSDITQHNYYQPLKFAQIDYAANNTSIKTGAANINQSDAWTNPDSKLQYMDINYDGIGLQMDADHEADEAELTEFSQVISSLDAGGKLHDIAKNVYNNLAAVARQASITEFEALNAFVNYLKQKGTKKEAVGQLYDLVARTIINNLDVKNKANLSDEIMSKIEKQINNNVSHILDEYKVPFSDPGIYQTLLPTFVSTINKKSVKRKYAGSGYVMHPSYGFIQVFDVDGVPYQFMDIYNQEKRNYGRQTGESLANYKRRVVTNFLNAKQLEQRSMYRSEFIPTQNVLVEITNGEKVYKINISLLNPKDYIIFKQDYWKYLIQDKFSEEGVKLTKDILNNSTFKFFNNVTKGRDLAPARITWTEADGRIHNIFDEKPLRNSFSDILNYKTIDGTEKGVIIPKKFLKISNIEGIKTFIMKTLGDTVQDGSIQITEGQSNRAEIQKVFRQIKQGKIGDRILSNVQNRAAEVILSSMHRSKFPEHSSLPDTLKNLHNFSFSNITNIPGINNYEFALVRQDKRHSFITFKKVESDLDNISSPQEIGFTYIKPVREGDRIVIYAMSKDSQLLFPIGAGEVKQGYTYLNSKEAQNPAYSIVKGNFVKGENGEVYEIEYFIKKYKVKHEGKSKTGTANRMTTHTVYEVNKELIDKYKQDTSSILSKLFVEEKALELRANYDTTYDKATLAQVVDKMQFDNSEMNNHKHAVYDVLIGKITSKEYKNKKIKDFYKNLNQALRTSFLMQLEITSSRIPAQTLQSFMQMQTIGYTQTRNNVCFVTPWQLFLQGSDYDIDKAYIMGCEIDDNGLYVGWSPLFNYYTLNTLKTSQKLPFPTGKLIEASRKKTSTIKTSNGEREIEKWNISQYIRDINGLYAAQGLLDLQNKQNSIDKIEYRKSREETQIKIIELYTKLLNELNERSNAQIYKVYIDEDITEEQYDRVISKINHHQSYKPSEEVLESSIKNSISSKINLIVQDLENMDHAYSPIEMSHIRPENSDLKVISLMNPASKFVMQVQNMVGKGVIGIAAVGEKIFFNLTYYWNEKLRTAKNPNDLRNLYFRKTFSRIKNRQFGIPVENTVDKLANINFDFNNVEEFVERFNILNDIYNETIAQNQELDRNSEEFKQKFHEKIRYYRDNESSADLYISELLSAATDNAKELILAQINSGTELAQNYLYLLSLGFEIKDIVAFMTSPAVSTIQSLSEFNMFNDHIRSLKIYDIVELLQGNLSKLYFTKDEVDNILKEVRDIKSEAVLEQLSAQNNDGVNLKKYAYESEEEIKELTELNEEQKNKVISIKNSLDSLDGISISKLMFDLDEDFIDFIKSNNEPKYDFLAMVLDKIKDSITPEYSEDLFFMDLNEFKKVNIAAQEATALGNVFLGLNQGIPSSQIDLLQKLRMIAQIVESREQFYGIDDYFRSSIISELNKKQKDIEQYFPQLQTMDENLSFFEKLQSLPSKDFINILLNFSPKFTKMIYKISDNYYDESYINDVNKQIKENLKLSDSELPDMFNGLADNVQYVTNILAFAIKEHTMSDGTSTHIISNMDPREWLINPKYRNFIKSYYNIIKDTWNPFDIVESVPQYKELINLLELVYQVNNALSVKSNVINRIHKKLLRQRRFLDEQKLRGIMEYVDNRLILSWMEGEAGQNFKFPVMEGETYIDINEKYTTSSTLQLLDLSTPEGRASFKFIMENYIIPRLQENTLKEVNIVKERNSEGKLVEKSKLGEKTIDVKNNKFIQGLIRSQNKNGVPFFKLDMDMTNVDGTPALQQQFQDYLDGLLELKSYTYAGHTLSDLFIMYNLLVNKNTYGQDRMTSIFRSFIQVVPEETLLKSYYKYVGEKDYTFDENTIEEDLGIDYDDLELYMARIINPAQESSALDKYIIEYEEGFPIYKHRMKDKSGKYKYQKIEINPVRRINFGIEENISNEAKAIRVQYFLMPSPHYENRVYYNRKLGSKDVNQIFEVLKLLQAQRIISLELLNCE